MPSGFVSVRPRDQAHFPHLHGHPSVRHPKTPVYWPNIDIHRISLGQLEGPSAIGMGVGLHRLRISSEQPGVLPRLDLVERFI